MTAMDKEQFRRALREAAGKEFTHIPPEEEIDYDFSEDFLDGMEQTVQPKKRRFSPLQRAAMILLCVGCIAALAGNADALQAHVLSPLVASLTDGRFKQGFNGNIYEEEFGNYYVYSGGEITIPYGVYNSEGAGVEVQIYLNGQPQAFRTEEDDTLRYTHYIFPIKKNTLQDLTFTPSMGQKGDILMITVRVQVLSADPLLEYSSGETSGIWLLYEADPPQTDSPTLHYCADSMNITITDDRSSIQRATLEVNNSRSHWVDYSEPITLQADLTGNDSGRQWLTFFIDGEPVLVDGKTSIPLDMDGTQRKTLVEITVQLPQDTTSHDLTMMLLAERSPGESLALNYYALTNFMTRIFPLE